ncbi:M14 family metallopeptidase [Salsipaludibacter albus]|uniref:M14 family metallopeptidase n=1 Tax=Salsipaludibacter albus TaxID=2849650 RepID=UPI001EE3C6BD|nr:M14 family metallopeptidase [Salsipaludibacter albus]MBY5162700.1 chitobiase/beta-hexosaminidase C-terminal domain-containing protein [Salsipaludibacter albus]
MTSPARTSAPTLRRLLGVVVLALAVALALLPGTTASAEDPPAVDGPSLVTLSIPDRATLDVVADSGIDLDHDLEPVGSGYEVTGVVWPDDVSDLRARGVGVTVKKTAAQLEASREALMDEREATMSAEAELADALAIEATDTVVIARADRFTSLGTPYLSVEAKSTDLNTVTLTVEWDAGAGTEIGDGGSTTLQAFNDAGEYQYHRRQINLSGGAESPTRVRVTSSNGGSAEADVTDWLGEPTKDNSPTYFQGFLDHYPDVYETNEILADLHEQFPDLTEIIELPYETNGYRRNAQQLSGGATSQRVGVDSHAWGHEGGNDLTIAYVAPGTANAPLSVSVSGDDITVSLATDGAGVVTSTAAQVVAALNASPSASDLVVAYTYRGNSGAGVVVPAGPAQLDDGLDAPEYVEREPFQPLMLRIGKHRDGSKTGVMTYSQEHAREWQTPLVNLETAHRLLYNYKTDAETKKIVDNLDIFIVPTVNPDGQLYSYYDFASQRKNMTRYCGIGQSNDFNARDQWGVDNNRNYTIGSLFDGYNGASTSCTSGTFAGPAELSEPESANIHWIPGEYDNIKFAMNIHSSGNYFMWSPGAYVTPGREVLPRPSLGTEDYFFAASEDILTEIHEYRGLTVTPARTGPIADVLYSAAGNSGDMLYYEYGLYAWNFEVGTSFQPQWDEAYNQMMEFSNGVVELYDVANDWTNDVRPPESSISPPGGRHSGPVALTFTTSEPADVYYTLDGSAPTLASTQYKSAGVREGGEEIMIDATTTVRWFSVDASGNVEKGYVPGRGNNARKATITIG